MMIVFQNRVMPIPPTLSYPLLSVDSAFCPAEFYSNDGMLRELKRPWLLYWPMSQIRDWMSAKESKQSVSGETMALDRFSQPGRTWGMYGRM